MQKSPPWNWKDCILFLSKILFSILHLAQRREETCLGHSAKRVGEQKLDFVNSRPIAGAAERDETPPPKARAVRTGTQGEKRATDGAITQEESDLEFRQLLLHLTL